MVDNLTIILFLCATVPMVPAIYAVPDKKSKLFLGYMLLGMVMCLIASELNSILLAFFGNDVRYVSSNITPIVEEALKALPVLYYAFFFSDNRETLLSMRDHAPGEHPVDEARAKQLEAALETYLNRYMAKRPEGHRWIVLSCLFLAFVARAPLHPGELLGHRRVGGAVLCPAREDSPDSLCRFCVCEREDQRLG